MHQLIPEWVTESFRRDDFTDVRGDPLECAKIADGRNFILKTPHWRPTNRDFTLRLAAECIYWVVASKNEVPMPDAQILLINGKICWGSEIKENRVALWKRAGELPNAECDRVLRSLHASREESWKLLHASFMDVFLLNADRTEPNILQLREEDRTTLFYIDHEQSCGCRNSENLRDNRIKSPEEEHCRIGEYTHLGQFHGWAAEISTEEDRREIFDGLQLDVAFLDVIPVEIRRTWLSENSFSERRAGLAAWWDYLKRRSFPELDRQIFAGSDR